MADSIKEDENFIESWQLIYYCYNFFFIKKVRIDNYNSICNKINCIMLYYLEYFVKCLKTLKGWGGQ